MVCDAQMTSRPFRRTDLTAITRLPVLERRESFPAAAAVAETHTETERNHNNTKTCEKCRRLTADFTLIPAHSWMNFWMTRINFITWSVKWTRLVLELMSSFTACFIYCAVQSYTCNAVHVLCEESLIESKKLWNVFKNSQYNLLFIWVRWSECEQTVCQFLM